MTLISALGRQSLKTLWTIEGVPDIQGYIETPCLKRQTNKLYVCVFVCTFLHSKKPENRNLLSYTELLYFVLFQREIKVNVGFCFF